MDEAPDEAPPPAPRIIWSHGEADVIWGMDDDEDEAGEEDVGEYDRTEDTDQVGEDERWLDLSPLLFLFLFIIHR